jgi:ankyrin repeat protein
MGNAATGASAEPRADGSRPPSARREELRIKLRSVIDFLQIAHYGANDLSLTEAVQLGFINEVRSILQNSECNMDEHDEDGNTPVMHAAGLPATLDDGLTAADFVKLLLEAKSNPNWQNTVGNTALHFACEDEDVSVISLLLQHGADSTLENADGQTPGDLCTTQATRDIIDDYGSGKAPDPDAATDGTSSGDEQAKTMNRISSKGNVLTVHTPAVLVRDLPSTATIDDCCKSKGTREDVERLLRKKADPNERDVKGSTPLMKAVWYENTGIIHTLLQAKVGRCCCSGNKSRSLARGRPSQR